MYELAVKNNTYNTGTIPTRISIFCLYIASIVLKHLQTFSLRPSKQLPCKLEEPIYESSFSGRVMIRNINQVRSVLLSDSKIFYTYFKSRIIIYAIRGHLNFNSRIIYAIRGYFQFKTMLIYAFWR